MAVAAGAPIEDLSHARPELLDALPFGVVQLIGDGAITAYSREEYAVGTRTGGCYRQKLFPRGCALHSGQTVLRNLSRFACEGQERTFQTALRFQISARRKTRGSRDGVPRKHGYHHPPRGRGFIRAEAFRSKAVVGFWTLVTHDPNKGPAETRRRWPGFA